MNAQICILIEKALKNKDQKIYKLFLNDPFFKNIYNVLRHNEDNPEIILNIIVELCNCRQSLWEELFVLSDKPDILNSWIKCSRAFNIKPRPVTELEIDKKNGKSLF